ncbi:MAG: DUF2249 domain-containing protein [Pseudomonadota bacterium]
MGEEDGDLLVDGRWLLPPEPMERVLTALETLSPGRRLRFLLHREPYPLYGILDGMGFRHETRPIEDQCFEILIEARKRGS